MKNQFLRRWTRTLESWVVVALLRGFALLPLDLASEMGAKILKNIGIFTPRHRIVLQNLARAFPDKSDQERRRIALAMWEHLGRIFAEMAFLKGDRLTSRIIEKQGLEHIHTPQAIYISGHFGQWELLNSVLYDRGIPIASVYRHLNNSTLDEQLKQIRLTHTTQLIRKKGDSAIAMVRILAQGINLSMLVDQRLTHGMVLPFLGIPAKTNVAAARLALKMKLPIVPAFITRLEGAYFKVEILPPLTVPSEGDEEDQVRQITLAFNRLLEERIRQHPEQWLWVHDRWK